MGINWIGHTKSKSGYIVSSVSRFFLSVADSIFRGGGRNICIRGKFYFFGGQKYFHKIRIAPKDDRNISVPLLPSKKKQTGSRISYYMQLKRDQFWRLPSTYASHKRSFHQGQKHTIWISPGAYLVGGIGLTLLCIL